MNSDRITGSGPQVMAALRNTAINIIRLGGGTNIAAAQRSYSYRPADVLANCLKRFGNA
jgi:hypothetical protein